MKSCRGIFGIAFTAMLLGPSVGRSQEPQQTVNDTTLEERLNTLERELESQTRENALQKKEIEALKSQAENNDADSDEEIALLDEFEEPGKDFQLSKVMSIHGFFDFEFIKLFLPDNNTFNLYQLNKSTFAISTLNLYFMSQMTQTLNTLVELRFSFMPSGYERDYEYIGILDGQRLPPEGQYTRHDSTVRDQVTQQHFRQGGLSIERVQLNYTPKQWFNIIAGRYLTPFGIWNVDHGSPVVLPVRAPYMVTQEMIPIAQTGIQVYGRVFPTDAIFLQYALTLSNGRGPIDEIVDLDEHKALGLRLKLNYETRKLRVSIGGYGYIGQYTDIKKAAVVELNPDLSVNADADDPISAEITETIKYKEYSASADFLFSLFGFKLQAEYIWRYVIYSIPDMLNDQGKMAAGATGLDTLYNANFIGTAFYALVSFELPLEKWLSPLRITPYFMFERSAPWGETITINSLDFLLAGINLKPSPFVVLKAEYLCIFPRNAIMFTKNPHYLFLQMAVSF